MDFSEKQINLTKMFFLMLRWWWVLAVFGVAFCAGAFYYTQAFIPKTYVSKGMMYINTGVYTSAPEGRDIAPNLADIVTAQRLAESYIEILGSRSYYERIKEVSAVELPAEVLRGRLVIASRNETEVLDVRAVDTDPARAELIVNAALESAKEMIKTTIGSGAVEIIDRANRPEKPAGPNTARNALTGGILGVFLGALLVFLLDRFDTRVKSQEDLTEKYSVPVLGMIPSFAFADGENTRYVGFGEK